jgi:hypothetical protein
MRFVERLSGSMIGRAPGDVGPEWAAAHCVTSEVFPQLRRSRCPRRSRPTTQRVRTYINDEFTAAIQRLTHRRVVAFMSAN